MAKLFIHAGQHKTGTSSLQTAFFIAKKNKSLHDIRYCDSPLRNHSFLTSSAFGNPNDMPYYRKLKNGVGIPLRHPDFRNSKGIIKKEIEAADRDGVPLLIISEDYAVLTPTQVLESRQFFYDCGVTDFLVTAYIRSCRSFVNSYSQQLLKQGFTIQRLLENPPIPQYHGLFQKLIDVYGRDCVKIRPFDPSHFVQGSLISDFLNMINKDLSKSFLKENKKNSSISLSLGRVLSYLNDNGGKKRYPPMSLLWRYRSENDIKFALTQQVLDKAFQRSRSDISWACNKLGMDPEFLSSPASYVKLEEVQAEPSRAELLAALEAVYLNWQNCKK